MADTVIRDAIADYLNVGTADAPKYVLMGTGFNNLDENPQAQVNTKAYINDKAATTIVRGYQTQFPFDTDLIQSEEAVMALYNVGRNQKLGAAAEFDYVRVELFLDAEDEIEYPARKFRVAAEISGIAGPGADIIHVTGNLNNVGRFVEGTFNIDTKTFTPATGG